MSLTPPSDRRNVSHIIHLKRGYGNRHLLTDELWNTLVPHIGKDVRIDVYHRQWGPISNLLFPILNDARSHS